MFLKVAAILLNLALIVTALALLFDEGRRLSGGDVALFFLLLTTPLVSMWCIIRSVTDYLSSHFQRRAAEERMRIKEIEQGK